MSYIKFKSSRIIQVSILSLRGRGKRGDADSLIPKINLFVPLYTAGEGINTQGKREGRKQRGKRHVPALNNFSFIPHG